MANTEDFRWASDGARPSLTEKFIFSKEQRPGPTKAQTRQESVPLPVIDMSGTDLVEMAGRIARASEELGFFTIINHGLPEPVWLRAAESVRDLFLLPPEVKARFARGGSIDSVKVSNFFGYDWEDQRRVSMWSEAVYHGWHPNGGLAGAFPNGTPPTYREHIVAYSKEMGVLMTRLLSLLSKGLGLEDDYLKRRLGRQPFLKCHGNYYPPCPNPELTLGLPIHTDSLALGVVRTLDSVPGLQILNDEQQWVAVDQLPNSFTVNIGDQLEVLSNGRYKSGIHRVVTNKSRARVSLAFFWGPGLNDSVGPIEELVDERNPPVYRSYVYKEFIEEHDKQTGKRRRVKEIFQLRPSAY